MSAPQRSAAGIATIVLLLFGFGFGAWWALGLRASDAPPAEAVRPTPPSGSVGATTPPVSPPGSARAAAPGRCGLPVGAVFSIEATDTSEIHADLGPIARRITLSGPGGAGVAAGAERMQVRHRWRLDARVVEARPDGSRVLRARLAGVTTEDASGKAMDDPLGDVTRPFLMRVDAGCRLVEFAWRRDADRFGVHNQQSLVASLGWSRGDTSRYSVSCFDVVGRYGALLEERDGVITGRRVDYLQVFSSGSSDRKVTIPRSTLRVERDGGPWFRRLASSQTLAYAYRGIDFGTVDSTVRAERRPKAMPVPDAPPPSDAGWVWGLLLEQARRAELAPKREQVGDSLRTTSLPDALKWYLSMVSSKEVNPADWVTYMRDWLRAHPEAIPKLLAMIRAGELDEHGLALTGIFLAMRLADTPQTRAALLDVFRDVEGFPLGHRLDAARELAFSERLPPGFTAELLAATEAAQTGFDRGALKLTTGMLVEAQSQRNPAAVQPVVDAMQNWLRSPGDDREGLLQSLQAVGNAGHDELASAVDAHLHGEDPKLRRFAAQAMRNMSPSVVHPLLAAAYASENSPGVRVSILDALLQSSAKGQSPLPVAVVQLVVDRIADPVAPPEYRQQVDFLGQAANAGNADATTALKAEFDAQLKQKKKDAGKLQALGQHVNTRWSAPKPY